MRNNVEKLFWIGIGATQPDQTDASEYACYRTYILDLHACSYFDYKETLFYLEYGKNCTNTINIDRLPCLWDTLPQHILMSDIYSLDSFKR